MMTPENQALNDKKTCEEFLTELAKLVNKYRAQLPTGMLVGALETVKFRSMYEANKAADKDMGIES